eukprot:CAMPEP_0185410032 /NCGR_PEP_ID=MMETSP1365-20130426/2863_1 /TAXON_ID=38817 /ORGANISM="Gephyrocapsa oceanica, Strain RCC1303" /LENGTH=141 /DNA_ID=CAMNT_0028012631 /DNA_START=158 /DNA_END=579 /DNA_ORIENTATION=+
MIELAPDRKFETHRPAPKFVVRLLIFPRCGVLRAPHGSGAQRGAATRRSRSRHALRALSLRGCVLNGRRDKQTAMPSARGADRLGGYSCVLCHHAALIVPLVGPVVSCVRSSEACRTLSRAAAVLGEWLGKIVAPALGSRP